MEVSAKSLLFSIMAYFSGIEWLSGMHLPGCTAWVDKVFPDYFCLNYAHRGTIQWQTDDRPARTMSAPVAWWTFPGPHFRYGSANGAAWDHYFICFRGSRVADYIAGGLLHTDSTSACAPVADSLRFRQGFEVVLGFSDEAAQLPQQRIHALEGLLLQLTAPTQPRQESDRDHQLRRLADEIRRAPGRSWEFPSEARQLGLSLIHFHRLFNRLMRSPPQRFVIRARMESAARLLHSSDLPLKQIAETVGYPDIYYFSRIFRQHFGVPPGRYRREAGLP